MKQAEKFRRAKSEWVSKFIPAPLGAWLCGKLRPVRFRRRAGVFQTNGTGPLSAVGAARFHRKGAQCAPAGRSGTGPYQSWNAPAFS